MASTDDGDQRAMKKARGDDGAHDDAGLGYVRSFIGQRLGSGSDLKGVLAEFRVPEDLWPSTHTAHTTLPTTGTSGPPDEVAIMGVVETIVHWLQDCPSAAESNDDVGVALQRSLDGNTATVGLLPYDGSLPLRSIAVDADAERWDSAAAGLKVTLNIELDAAAVAVSSGGSRFDVSHVVVLDNLFGEKENAEFLRLVVSPGWDDKDGPCPDLWELGTCDADGLPPSWGLKSALLTKLLDSDCEAIVEVQTRLQQLYPEYTIAHVDESAVGVGVGAGPHVVNAAVCGGDYRWHIDADPRMLNGFGYPNREPGKPYFVTMLIYINEGWPTGWDAETFFLDMESDTGFFVRPAQFRTILMDQDITHRMSAPSKLANGKPRYSLVWKLLFVPKDAAISPSIAKTAWGPPVRLGAS